MVEKNVKQKMPDIQGAMVEKNVKQKGVTLVELMIVISIVGIIFAVAATEVFIGMSGEARVKEAVRGLYDNLKYAQAEAQKQGGYFTQVDPPTGQTTLQKRRIFVVFNEANNEYEIWRWQDENNDNIPDAGEYSPQFNNPGNDGDLKTVSLDQVYFGFTDVTKKACDNDAGAPSDFVSFNTSAFFPCSGNPCIRFDSNGFIEDPTDEAVIYLTDNSSTYAVSGNPAGIFRMCEWTDTDGDGTKDSWIYTR